MVYPYYNTSANPFIEINILEDTDKDINDESFHHYKIYQKLYTLMV